MIDSLLVVLKEQSGISKVKTLNDLAWEYRKSEPVKALKFAQEAKKISDSLDYIDGKLTSQNRIGVIAIYQKEFEKAEKIYLGILDKEIDRNNDYGIGRALNQLGGIYTEKEELEKALDYTLKAEEKFELLNKRMIVAITSNNIGNLYRRMGNYQKAMKYFEKSLQIKKSSGNDEAIALTLQNIGLFQISIKNYDKALEYLKKSEEIFKKIKDDVELSKVYNNIGLAYFSLKDYQTALKFYETSIELKSKLGIKEKDHSVYNNLGTIYYQSDKYDLALLNYQKSEKINPTSITINNIAHIYSQKNNYQQAIEYYKKALSKAEKNGLLFEKMTTLSNLSSSYFKLKNYQLARKYNSQYLKVRDSLENNYVEAINEQLKYEEEQKKMELLKKDEEAKSKRKTILIYGLVIGILLLLLLFFAIIRGNRQKQLKQLAEKNRQIQEQKVEELLKSQELKSINAMMEGQEKERKRIGEDLHDRLGGKLAMVKNHFKSVEEEISRLQKSTTKLYNKANELLDEACEEVRKISHNIISGVLTTFGLTAALEDLKEALEQDNKLEVELVCHGMDDRLPLEHEIAIYRIVQELVSNILKHAKATEITIQLVKGKNGLNIFVEDNGIGFDTNEQSSGIGLENMKSRVKSFQGKLNIDSIIDKGTIVTIDVPLNNKN